MTFRDYVKYNLKAIIHSLKWSGVIFSVVSIIFILPSDAFADSKIRLLIVFIISILSGNIFSFIICCLKLNSTFQQTKRNFRLFDGTSKSVIDRYFLQVKPKANIKKYDFLEINLVGKIDKTPLIIELSDKKEVWVTIINKLDSIPDFPKRSLKIENKYRKQNITLTGWGFRKLINSKKWKNLKDEEIEYEIRQLFKISDDENIKY